MNQEPRYGPGDGSAPITATGGEEMMKAAAAGRPTRKPGGLLPGFVVSAVHHFIEGTISFQNVGLKPSQRLARARTRTHCWQVDICS